MKQTKFIMCKYIFHCVERVLESVLIENLKFLFQAHRYKHIYITRESVRLMILWSQAICVAGKIGPRKRAVNKNRRVTVNGDLIYLGSNYIQVGNFLGIVTTNCSTRVDEVGHK